MKLTLTVLLWNIYTTVQKFEVSNLVFFFSWYITAFYYARTQWIDQKWQ